MTGSEGEGNKFPHEIELKLAAFRGAQNPKKLSESAFVKFSDKNAIFVFFGDKNTYILKASPMEKF